MYHDGGAAIIALIDHILHRERTLTASSKLDNGILLSEDEINAFNRAATAAHVDNGEVAVARATIESYANLSEDEKLLDSSLCNIMDSCISGPLRTALPGVQIGSFVQAWVLIQKEQGTTNSQRKTELVGRLMDIVYNPSEQNSAQFMNFIIQDLLDFAQIKSDKFRQNYQEFNIKECIENVMCI